MSNHSFDYNSESEGQSSTGDEDEDEILNEAKRRCTAIENGEDHGIEQDTTGDQEVKESLSEMKDMLKLLCEKVDKNEKGMKDLQRRLVILVFVNTKQR